MSMALFAFLQNKLKKLQLATEKRLSPLEEQFHALTQANINMEPTVEESATGGIAALPKNAADGPFSRFILGGHTATNLIKNGNFANGTTGWTAHLVNVSVENGECKMVATSAGGSMNRTIGINTIIGHKYYVAAEVKADSNLVRVGMRNIASPWESYGYASHTGSGQYELVSVVVTATTAVSMAVAWIYDQRSSDWTEISFKKVRLIDLTATFGSGNEPTKEQCDAMFPYYFDGTKSVSGSFRIKSVGKNLFPNTIIHKMQNAPIVRGTLTIEGSKIKFVSTSANAYTTNYVISGQLPIPLRQYTIKIPTGPLYYKRKVEGLTSGHTEEIFFYYDINYNFISQQSVARGTDGILLNIFTVPENVYYATLRLGASSPEQTIYYSELMLSKFDEEYEPYSAQDVYVNCGELRRLPNGVCDEYDVLSGIKIQKIKEKILQASDISSSIIQYTNVDVVLVNLTDNKPFTTSGLGDIVVAGMDYTTYAERDNVENIGKYYVTQESPNRIQFIVAKGTTIEQARQQLVGTKIIYQLAEQIITKYYPQTLTSKPSGTIFCEPVLGDADFYGQGITLEGFTFTSIDKVTKVDLESGIEIDVTNTCTLNAAKNGFTSTALQAGDICWYELRIDPETTLIPEMEYAYYDSRYVVVDDSNGKYYRWKIASTDGVPRIELEEV